MAGTLKDIRLQDRLARTRLKARHHPYWRGLSEGFHLGYYRGKRSGAWVARYRRPGSGEAYRAETLGQSDDLLAADGKAILSWSQAFEKATAWAKRQRKGPHVTNLKLADLAEGDLRHWQRGLGDMKSTTKRRLINDLKAALNDAYLDNRLALPVDIEKTIKVGLKPVFEDDIHEPVARVDQVLTNEQLRDIIRAAADIDEDGDFGRMVLVLAATGARFSQVRRMLVQDVQVEQSRLLVPPLP